MSKRFIASELWDKDWFLELPSKYKILWIYMITKCDVAGVFDPNLKTISKLLNEKYIETEILTVFTGKIRKIQDKWLLIKFIDYQYGNKLSPCMVKPINNTLRKIGLNLDTVLIQYKESIDTPKDKDKDKDKDNKGIVKGNFDFEQLWAKYPNKDGKKAALQHFKTSVIIEQDWQDIQTALNNYLINDKVKKGFIKNGSTWFNNWRDWIVPPIKEKTSIEKYIKED